MKQLEEQLVPYDEAFKLQQIGFDEECFGIALPSNQDVIISFCAKYKGNKHLKVQVPTYQQVFEWFREKHKLFHHIYSVDEFRQDVWWEGRIYGKTKNRRDIKVAPAETYREAELECIRKLIELVQ